MFFRNVFTVDIIQFVKNRWRGYRGRNLKLDKETILMSDEAIAKLLGKEIIRFDRGSNDFWQWLKLAKLSEFLGYSYPHKKALEFFFSSQLLEISEEDVILDAAGGESNYLLGIKHTFHPAKLILHDQIYDVFEEKDGILTIDGDISSIPLPDNSVDKISCHHAFEHFQGDKDILFIKEIARLLKPGGKAAIIPLFISEKYIECWNIKHYGAFDSKAELLIDTTATLPGGPADGHFARIYSPEILRNRILNLAENVGLTWSIITCKLDRQDTPDMSLNLGAKINSPLRALLLEK